MAADPSILEGILQDIATAVQGIKKADGFAHDMPPGRVFRLRHRGEPNVGEGVSANVAWLSESSEEHSTTVHDELGHGQAKTTAQIAVDVFALPRASGVASKDNDADLVAWVSDVVVAVMWDKQRGGRAETTIAGDRSPWRTPKYYGVTVLFTVPYIHREEDPSAR